MKRAAIRLGVMGSLTASSVLATALPATAADGGGVPNPDPNLPGGLQSDLDTLLGMLMAIAIIACVAGLFIVAILMAVAAKRGSIDDHFGRLAAVAIACVLIGSGVSVVNFLVL